MEMVRAQRADLIDPATLASLGRVEIIARWIVDGFLTGLHRSPRRGFSVEFAEHRPYQLGDDLRYLDWKIAARSDRSVIKQFEEETNLRATIVLDVSKSMAWSGRALGAGVGAGTRVAELAVERGADTPPPVRELTKLAYAEQLTAAIALLLLRQRDAVGLIRFDDGVRSMVPPRARRGQWRRLIASLDEGGAGRASSAPEALEQAARLVPRRGLVVLVSDLLMEPARVELAIRSLRAAGHDVAVMHVMDPAERELPPSGDAVFVDPESGVELPAVLAEVRAAYRATVEEVIGEWRRRLGAAGAGYDLVLTNVPFGIPLRRAFAARQRLP
jgi:uncharacterized protein (DUF58 family)